MPTVPCEGPDCQLCAHSRNLRAWFNRPWSRFKLWFTHSCCTCDKRMWFNTDDFCSAVCMEKWLHPEQ